MKTFQKGWQLHTAEVAAQQQEQPSAPDSIAHTSEISDDYKLDVSPYQSNGNSKGILSNGDGPACTHDAFAAAEGSAVLADEVQSHTESEQNALVNHAPAHQEPADEELWVPWKVVQFGQLSCLWAAFLGLQYGKVSFSQCSWQYALLCSAQALFSVITTGFFILQARMLRPAQADDLQTPLLSKQTSAASHHNWPVSQLMKCVVVVLFGGVVAGMLGFGGGMVLNPLMLEMGINPLVSSATSSLMVLFSASAATFSFAVSGRLNYQYALVYGCLCAVASIIGVAVISASVRRSGRGSQIVFTLALIIATGALMQAVFGGIAAVRDVRTGRHLSFSPLC